MSNFEFHLMLKGSSGMNSFRSYLIRLYIKRKLKKIESMPLAKKREFMDKNAKIFPIANTVRCESVIISGRKSEWLIPKDEDTNSAILYLHGGAYTAGSLDSHRGLASRIAKTSKVRVLLIDYRLAPEFPFPAALEDSIQAFKWMQKNRGITANRIIVMGDSAGGGLALCTAIRLRNLVLDLPRALICLSPWTDLSLSGESIQKLMHADPFFSSTVHIKESASAYAGTESLQHAEISPLFATLNGLPPIFIQVGSDEILLSDSVQFSAAARCAGVNVQVDIWPGMWHVWQGMCDLMPESRQAIEFIGHLVANQLSDLKSHI